MLFIAGCCIGAFAIQLDNTVADQRAAQMQIRTVQNPVTVSGVILNPSTSRARDGSIQYFGKLEQIKMITDKQKEPYRVPGFIYISGSTKQEISHASYITATGSIELPKRPRNFFYTSQSERWLRQNVVASISKSQILTIDPTSRFLYRLYNRIERRLDASLNEHSAQIAKALFLGGQSDLDREDKQRITDAGLLHLFAISGFHIGILGGFMLILCNRLFRNQTVSYLLVVVFLIGYGSMIGWRPSVSRAVIMVGFFLVAKLSFRKPDYLNITSLAGVVLLLIDPDQLFLPGFQLSFAAVYGLVLWLNRILPTVKRKDHAVARWILLSGGSSCVAWAATMPIVLYWFGQSNAMAPIWNLGVAPLAVLLTTLSMMHALSLILFQEGIGIIASLLEWTVVAFRWSVNHIATFPFGVIFSPKPNLASCFTYYVIAQAILWTRNILPATRWICLVSLSIGALIGFSLLPALDRSNRVVFMDAGQADAAFFRFKEGYTMLVDTGKPYQPNMMSEGILPLLKHYGKKHIDVIVISHPQFDHAGALQPLMEHVEVRHLITSGDSATADFWMSAMKTANQKKVSIHRVEYQDKLSGFGSTSIQVLHPPKYFTGSLNDRSVVLLLTIANKKILMTGDLGAKGIDELMFENKLPQMDILKVPHHGADFGDSGWRLLRNLRPKIAVMSLARENRYGHPRKNTLDAVSSNSNAVYRTDEVGAVSIDLDTLKVQIATQGYIEG